MAIFVSFVGQISHFLRADSNTTNPSRTRRCMIILEGIWSKNAEEKEETVEFGSVAKIRNLQISQVAKFRNTAPLHYQFDCFLTRFFLALYKSSLDVNLFPLHIFVISLVLSTYISSVKLVTSINFQSINHSIKLAPNFPPSRCV